MYNIGYDDRQENNKSSGFKLTTKTDIELVVTKSEREREKVKKANLSPVSYLSPAVLWFAQQMQAKLDLPRVQQRGDSFKHMTPEQLIKCIRNEIVEVQEASGEDRVVECADIANFAMFLAINTMISTGKAE